MWEKPDAVIGSRMYERRSPRLDRLGPLVSDSQEIGDPSVRSLEPVRDTNPRS